MFLSVVSKFRDDGLKFGGLEASLLGVVFRVHSVLERAQFFSCRAKIGFRGSGIIQITLKIVRIALQLQESLGYPNFEVRDALAFVVSLGLNLFSTRWIEV